MSNKKGIGFEATPMQMQEIRNEAVSKLCTETGRSYFEIGANWKQEEVNRINYETSIQINRLECKLFGARYKSAGKDKRIEELEKMLKKANETQQQNIDLYHKNTLLQSELKIANEKLLTESKGWQQQVDSWYNTTLLQAKEIRDLKEDLYKKEFNKASHDWLIKAYGDASDLISKLQDERDEYREALEKTEAITKRQAANEKELRQKVDHYHSLYIDYYHKSSRQEQEIGRLNLCNKTHAESLVQMMNERDRLATSVKELGKINAELSEKLLNNSAAYEWVTTGRLNDFIQQRRCQQCFRYISCDFGKPGGDRTVYYPDYVELNAYIQTLNYWRVISKW